MSKPPTAVPGRGGFFSLFDLPPTIFNAKVLQKLGKAMATAIINSDSLIDSGYVYFAQIISHDISRRAPPPSGHEFSPPGELQQLRTPELDLDNVYGDGFYDRNIAVDETREKCCWAASSIRAISRCPKTICHGGPTARRASVTTGTTRICSLLSCMFSF